MSALATTSENQPSRYLMRGTWLFLVAAVIVPNIFFLLAMPAYIAERALSPILYLLAGLLSLHVSRFLSFVTFLIAATIDLALIVMVAFHLPLATAINSLQDMATINIAASAFYIFIVCIVLTGAMLAAWLTQRHRTEMRLSSPLPAVLAACAIVGLDARFNVPYVIRTTPPFESALGNNEFSAETVSLRGTNLMIVMVEGLGAFANKDEKDILAGKLASIEQAGAYSLKSGTTSYSGSTTGAESRELCGRWGDHLDYLTGESYDCLPRRLATMGFETIAFHGFSSSMFSRDVWYPRIGFNELNFAPEIELRYPGLVSGRCGTVFEGLCDTDVASAVHARLKQKVETRKLVYWLTLNSHIPYQRKPDGPLGCGTVQPAIDNRTVCDLTELWADVFDAVAAIARDPELPPTDILIVGDHHTPLWERDAKHRFILGRTDWYLLQDNRSRPAS